MKIALPSDDKITIAPHFGRTAGFLVFIISDTDHTVKTTEYRPSGFPKPGHVDGHVPGGHATHQQSKHTSIISGLKDCCCVIASGMGRRIYDEFTAAGKKVFVAEETNAAEAVKKYLADTLKDNPDKTCAH